MTKIKRKIKRTGGEVLLKQTKDFANDLYAYV